MGGRAAFARLIPRLRRNKLYCLECGTQLEERSLEGRQRLVCPACGYVHYPQLKVGAGSLLIHDGRLLLVQRGPQASAFPGTWCLPAGYCEADEPPALTAIRETEEETGLEVHISCMSGTYYFDDDPRGNGVLLVYEAEVAGGPAGGDLHAHAGHRNVDAGRLILDGDRPKIDAGRLKIDGEEIVAADFFAPGHLPAPLCGGGHDQAIRTWQARALDRWDPSEPMRYCPYCTCPLEDQSAFGRVRPVCPTCGYIHFLTPKVGVSILVERDGHVLLVRRAIEPGLGHWSLPSGFIEWDEAPEVAAVREVGEETGLVVANARLIDVVRYAEDFRGPGLNINYRATVVGGTLEPADDAAEARFFGREDLPPLDEIAFASHRQLLAQWRREPAGES
ncbi:MAG: NUDIX domain-containing protein [Anaerolineae bacterium]